MKISTAKYENLDYTSRKSRPAIIKISTVNHENLGMIS